MEETDVDFVDEVESEEEFDDVFAASTKMRKEENGFVDDCRPPRKYAESGKLFSLLKFVVVDVENDEWMTFAIIIIVGSSSTKKRNFDARFLL